MEQLILWGSLFVAFVIAESVSAQLISIWFAAGSLVSFLIALFTDSWALQILAFILVSVLLLLLTRPLLKKFIVPKMVKTNASDSLLGKECVVLQEINNLRGTGRISDDGLSWNARSDDPDMVIPENATVQVVRLQGVTAYVVLKPEA